jgi:hypothetical protein
MAFAVKLELSISTEQRMQGILLIKGARATDEKYALVPRLEKRFQNPTQKKFRQLTGSASAATPSCPRD